MHITPNNVYYHETESAPFFGTHNPKKRTASLAWLGFAPLRVEAFDWLALSGKISMADNLRWRDLISEAISELRPVCFVWAREANG